MPDLLICAFTLHIRGNNVMHRVTSYIVPAVKVFTSSSLDSSLVSCYPLFPLLYVMTPTYLFLDVRLIEELVDSK